MSPTAAGSVELVDVQRLMSLFAQGIGGRYFHLRAEDAPDDEGAARRLPFGAARAQQSDGNVLLLPDRIGLFDGARANLGAYRVAVMHQLGFLEFGTYAFDHAEARRRIPALPVVAGPGPTLHPTDLESFFDSLRPARLTRRVFTLLEDLRIDCALRRGYPGLNGDLDRVMAFARAQRAALAWIESPSALMEALLQLSLEQAPEPLLARDGTGRLAEVVDAVRPLALASADVYTTARATLVCVEALRGALRAGRVTGVQDAGEADGEALELELSEVARELDAIAAESEVVEFRGEPALEVMQRRLQLEAREVLLDALERARGQIPAEALARRLEESGLDAVAPGEVSGPALDSADLDRPPASAEARLERLTRRTEYDRATLRRGATLPGLDTRSYLYDEWDHVRRQYLRGWCRLHEDRLQGSSGPDFLDGVRQRHRDLLGRVRRQFRSARPEAYQRLRGLSDGDEIDLDRAIETRIDRRAGLSLADRVYSRRDRARREVAAAFLLDLSASVSEPVPDPDEPPPPTPARGSDGRPVWPGDDDDIWDPPALPEPKRRVIDIEKEAVALMVLALETLGDEYAVYGFSGSGRENVEFFVAKEFDDALRAGVWGAIDAMAARGSTRMGTAIRHTVAKLSRQEARRKVLLLVSDGFPQDTDYGPDRNDREYGIQDTARALEEAERAGIRTFCVTIDRAGHDYLRRMCPEGKYLVIDEVESLPAELGKVYRSLTRM